MHRMLVVPLLLLAASATAQETPSLVLSADAGPAFALQELAHDGAGLGWGAGASAAVRIVPLIGLYAAYERTFFPVDARPGSGAASDWTDTGVGLGAQLWLPVREGARLRPWARIGVGWHDVDVPIARPEFSEVDTEGIRTLEAGGGLDIAVGGPGLFLRPMVRYRTYRFEVVAPTRTAVTRTSYLTVGLGLVLVLADRDGRRQRNGVRPREVRPRRPASASPPPSCSRRADRDPGRE